MLRQEGLFQFKASLGYKSKRSKLHILLDLLSSAVSYMLEEIQGETEQEVLRSAGLLVTDPCVVRRANRGAGAEFAQCLHLTGLSVQQSVRESVSPIIQVRSSSQKTAVLLGSK